jgi:hypothetical protein
MSLSDVKTIPAVKIDVTPAGGATVGREYIAKNVRVQRLWRGRSWRTADGANKIVTQYRHLVFTLSGSDIDQVSNTGDLRAPTLLQLDLEEPESYTVELYPDASQSKKFTVIAFQPDRLTLAEFEHLARADEDTIQCITQNTVSRADVEWFRKYG